MTTDALWNRFFLQLDATNRAHRTLLNGAFVDVLLAVALVAHNFLEGTTAWGEIDWMVFSFVVTKTAVMTGLAYVLRRFLDASPFPTPLPPVLEQVAEPVEAL